MPRVNGNLVHWTLLSERQFFSWVLNVFTEKMCTNIAMVPIRERILAKPEHEARISGRRT